MRRFGSWNDALKEAGFDVSHEIKIDGIRLFENPERLRIALGRQPTKRDLSKTISQFWERPTKRSGSRTGTRTARSVKRIGGVESKQSLFTGVLDGGESSVPRRKPAHTPHGIVEKTTAAITEPVVADAESSSVAVHDGRPPLDRALATIGEMLGRFKR